MVGFWISPVAFRMAMEIIIRALKWTSEQNPTITAAHTKWLLEKLQVNIKWPDENQAEQISVQLYR